MNKLQLNEPVLLDGQKFEFKKFVNCTDKNQEMLVLFVNDKITDIRIFVDKSTYADETIQKSIQKYLKTL